MQPCDEYLTAEELEMAGRVTMDFGKTRVSPHHIMLAIVYDAKRKKTLRPVWIMERGVLPSLCTSQ